MADVNNRPAARCTILIDEYLYVWAKRKALDKKMKLYQYINFLIAEDTKKKFPVYLKHMPSNNKAKQPLRKNPPSTPPKKAKKHHPKVFQSPPKKVVEKVAKEAPPLPPKKSKPIHPKVVTMAPPKKVAKEYLHHGLKKHPYRLTR